MSSLEEIDLHEICATGNAGLLKLYLESEDYDPRSLFDKNEDGLIPYQVSLLHCQIACVELILSKGLEIDIPYLGLFPIHLALAPAAFKENHCAVLSLVQIMARNNVDITRQDRLGRTALHFLCCTGPSELIPVLLNAGLKLETRDLAGKMAIHYAIERNQAECLKILIQEGGSDMFFCTDSRGDKPVHVAVRSASWDCFKVLLSFAYEEMLNEHNESEQTPLEVSKSCGLHEEFQIAKSGGAAKSSTSTVILTDSIFQNHVIFPSEFKGGPDWHKLLALQPENQERLERLCSSPEGSLLTDEFCQLVWKKKISPVNLADVLRVHEFSYVKKLKEFVGKIDSDLPARFDVDTRVSKDSFQAALVAAGCVVEAVDLVLQGVHKNAFCAVRPPGHHVGPLGAVASDEDPSLTSNGFCLFNNVAIGAAYAKYMYSRDVKKIAIIDFDVHHGNGTEAIVRNLLPSSLKTRLSLPVCFGSLEYASFKPWLGENDAKDILFVSSHAYGREGKGFFYPASGTKSTGEDLFPGGILNIPLSKSTDSQSFRNSYRTAVFPRLLAFVPDLIFLSSGFDAHGLDEINHGFIDLDEDDFRWITEELLKIANTCCKGRVVSVLEGGYGIRGGLVSVFGQSVASHVRAMLKSNSEHYTETSNKEDVEKHQLKIQLNEKHRELKRSRSKYLKELEEECNKKTLMEVDGKEGENQEIFEEIEEDKESEEGDSEDQDSENQDSEDQDSEDQDSETSNN